MRRLGKQLHKTEKSGILKKFLKESKAYIQKRRTDKRVVTLSDRQGKV